MTYPVVHEGRSFTPDGEIARPAAAGGYLLNCGHRPAPAHGVAPGYGLILGYTICYPCMTEWERSFFADATAFAGYLSRCSCGGCATGLEFTTWTGGVLGRVTSMATSPPQWTPTGGRYRLRRVRVVALDGSMWHGAGSDQHDLITMRRCAS